MLVPILVVGLGGTGKAVIYALKRRLYQHFGVERLPITWYLEFDTDHQDFDNVTRNLDEFTKDRLKLEPSEFIKAEIEGDWIITVREDAKNYKSIHEWFPNTLFRFPPGVLQKGTGAAGLRAIGRLAFYRALLQFQNWLAGFNVDQGAVAQTSQRFGQQVSQDFYVFFVFSVAGGTGSGSFIDAAYFVRQELGRKNINAKFYAIVALPQVFQNSQGDVQIQAPLLKKLLSNGYAALSELEFFNRGKGARITLNWNTPWATKMPNFKPHSGPFDIVFLTGPNPLGVQQSLAKEEIFGMMADFIFESHLRHDFLESFAAKQVNAPNAFAPDDSLEMNFSTQYAVFGLSRIGFSRRGAQLAAVYSALSEIFEEYAEGSDAMPRKDENLLEDVFGFAADLPRSSHEFVEKYSVAGVLVTDIPSRQINRLQDYLNEVTKPERDIEVHALRDAYEKYVNQLRERAREFIEEFNRETDRFARPLPSIPSQIAENAKRFLQQKVVQLEDYIKQIVLDREQRGIVYAEETLRNLKTNISNLLRTIEKTMQSYNVSIPEIPSPPDMPTSDKIYKIKTLFDDAKRIVFWPFRSHAVHYYQSALDEELQKYSEHLDNLSTEFKRAIEDVVHQFVKSRIGYLALVELSKVLREFENKVEGMQDNLLTQFKEFADRLFGKHFHAYASSLVESGESTRAVNILALRLADIKNFVWRSLDKVEFERSVGEKLWNHLRNTPFGKGIENPPTTIGEFLWEVARRPGEATSLLASFYECFERAANDIVNDRGQDIFNESFAAVWANPDAQKHIARVASQGLPYFSLNAGATVRNPIQYFAAVDLPATIDGEGVMAQFGNVCGNQGLPSTPAKRVLSDDDRIVFFSVAYGVTCPQIKEIETLWSQYEAFSKEIEKTYYPHIDKRIKPYLPPLVDLPSEEVNRVKQDIWLIFSGFLWGVVDLRDDTEGSGERIWSVKLPASNKWKSLASTLFSSANMLSSEVSYKGVTYTLRDYIGERIKETKEYANSNPEALYWAKAVFRFASDHIMEDEIQFGKMLKTEARKQSDEIVVQQDFSKSNNRDKFIRMVNIPEIAREDKRYNGAVLFVFKAPEPSSDWSNPL